MKQKDLRLLKNIRLMLLVLIALVSQNYFLLFLYTVYSLVVYVLEERKIFVLENSTSFEQILDKVDNSIIYYAILLVLLSNKDISSIIIMLLLALDFIISGKEALQAKKNKKYDKLLNYSMYIGLILCILNVLIFKYNFTLNVLSLIITFIYLLPSIVIRLLKSI